jgi:hypothetical protein
VDKLGTHANNGSSTGNAAAGTLFPMLLAKRNIANIMSSQHAEHHDHWSDKYIKW